MSKIDVICDDSQAKLKEVPARVLQMTRLQMLYLEGNCLEYLPDDFFQKLPRLSWLDLRNNKLKFIPIGIAYHAFLEYFLLENNEIEALPNEIGLIPNLKVLQLANNPLEYPPEEVTNQGTEVIANFLKEQYCTENAVNVPPTEETASTKDSESTIIPCKTEEISVRELLRRSSNTAKLRIENFPVITVRSLSIENEEALRNKNKSVTEPAPVPSSTTLKQNSKKAHKISRFCSKVHYAGKTFLKEKSVQNIEDKVATQELKDMWLSKLKELLADQETLLQRERNLKSLNAWRLNKKLELPRAVIPNRKLTVPYDTNSDYDKILSRKDLAEALDNVMRKGKSVPKNLDMQKMISDVVYQLKNLQVAKSADVSPRSEIINAEKEIQTLINLHKRVTALQSKNDSH